MLNFVRISAGLLGFLILVVATPWLLFGLGFPNSDPEATAQSELAAMFGILFFSTVGYFYIAVFAEKLVRRTSISSILLRVLGGLLLVFPLALSGFLFSNSIQRAGLAIFGAILVLTLILFSACIWPAWIFRMNTNT